MVSSPDDQGSLKPLRIFLLGFMGAGKTTAGKLLAEETGWSFFDMDELIEEKENKKIAKIFADRGEQYFREVETEVLSKLSQRRPPVIISCGGGVALRRKNRKIMEENGVPIYLHVTPQQARERIGVDSNRPLFSGEKEEFERLKKLWKKRQKVYNKIPHRIEPGAPEEIIENIKAIIRNHALAPEEQN